MTVALKGELVFFLFSFLFGVAVGFYYDGFRFLRAFFGLRGGKKGKRRAVAEGILLGTLDFLFIFSGGVAYTVLIYGTHSGVFRFYSLFALTLGVALYMKTLSRLALPLLLFLAKAVRRALKTVFYPFFRISRAFSHVFLHILCKIRCFLRKNVLNYNKRSKKRNNKKAKTAPKEKSKEQNGALVFGKRG